MVDNPNIKTVGKKGTIKLGKNTIQERHVNRRVYKELDDRDLREIVELPNGENLDEWLAVNTVDFFNQINMLYGTLVESCTVENCDLMNAGPKYEYNWTEGGTRTKKLPAPEYMENLMNWIQNLLDNTSIFPSEADPFPKNFKKIVKKIFSRLFRVYAHIYHSHFSEVIALEEDAYLNTSFKHFILFIRQFKLVNEDQLLPLEEVIHDLVGSNRENNNNNEIIEENENNE